jgi:four helix bundle protein
VGGVRSFRDLLVYQSARKLVVSVRGYTASFPADERYILCNQARRAASSIPLNIAEGYGIGTTKATLRHLRIARGSLCELEAALDQAQDAGYGSPDPNLLELNQETAPLLQGLIRSLERKRDQIAD